MARASLKGVPRRLLGKHPRGARGQFIKRSSARAAVRRITQRTKRKPSRRTTQRTQKPPSPPSPPRPTLFEWLVSFSYLAARRTRMIDFLVTATDEDSAIAFARKYIRRRPKKFGFITGTWAVRVVKMGPSTKSEGHVDER